ncbi:MAG: SUMF1/EgtB/PvdO family nonheme iron enzyme [Flavobacteriales bacterium]|nr:SUMF1/EgtB/PvdO family nonheme iron enzyme [Flavobacteriales bacterium]
MKYLITSITIALFVCSFSLKADETPSRQKVYSLVKQYQTTDWYSEQAIMWGEYLATNDQDGDAWLNFYTAKRMLKIYRQGVSHDDLVKIVEDMGKAIPNSFEFHYVSYWNGGNGTDPKLIEHLNKAYEIDPRRPELHDDFMSYYELNRDMDMLEQTAKKWLSSNDISTGLYAWNYNMLQSCEQNAILFTSGDNDTYPAIVLQHGLGIRTDVSVINAGLIAIDDYRNKWFAELDMPEMTKKYDDFEGWAEVEDAIIAHFKDNANRPIYFSISARPRLYEAFKDEIHNVGMAYKWSPKKFDNIAVLKRNYEKHFLTDYLKYDFQNDISQGVVDHMNGNYLIPLLTLHNHYNESEDPMAEETGDLIQRIAEKNNMEDQVAEVLNKTNRKHASSIGDPRVLTENFVKISDTLYAGKFEVSNKEYERFQMDLLKQKRYDDIQVAKAAEVNWKGLLSPGLFDDSESGLFEHGHPEDAGLPIVNVSYAAAELYCHWLTEVYNNMDSKKKKFDNVEFRLPSEKEWEYLAKSGKQESAYAWGGPYVRNAKGCFLANLDMTEVDKKAKAECAGEGPNNLDGGIFTVPVGSYLANDFGLFNMTGNVSEMIQSEGITKGGSWNTKAGIATLDAKESILTPSPEVGFRVIMIVK